MANSMIDTKRLTISKETYEAYCTELCDRIYEMTLKGQDTITADDVYTFYKIAEGVYYAVHKTAEALNSELQSKIHNEL